MTARPLALVTGANRGIGLAIADKLAQDGFDLVITGLEADDGGATERLRAHGGAVEYLPGEISDLAVHAVWMSHIAAQAGLID